MFRNWRSLARTGGRTSNTSQAATNSGLIARYLPDGNGGERPPGAANRRQLEIHAKQQRYQGRCKGYLCRYLDGVRIRRAGQVEDHRRRGDKQARRSAGGTGAIACLFPSRRPRGRAMANGGLSFASYPGCFLNAP